MPSLLPDMQTILPSTDQPRRSRAREQKSLFTYVAGLAGTYQATCRLGMGLLHQCPSGSLFVREYTSAYCTLYFVFGCYVLAVCR